MIKLQGKELVREYPNSVPKNPKVSVLVQTYQHAAFIKDCLDSILAQKTDFNYEILIGDDNSTDGTREICIDYAKTNPTIIKLFLHDRKNNIEIGGIKTGRYNLIFNLQQAQGKYLAMCEGDDYWLDNYKLQKQVGYLDQHPKTNFSMGGYKIFNQSTSSFYSSGEKEVDLICGIKKYLSAKFSHTSTFVFRNSFKIPNWYLDTYMGDQALVLIATGEGDIFIHHDIFSVYRIEVGGVSTKINITNKFLQYIHFFRMANRHTNGKYLKTIAIRFFKSLPMFIKLAIKSLR